jgi:outer membrane biosynthesis protein TonB
VNQSTPEFVTQSMALAFTAAALFALHARGPDPAPAVPVHDPGVTISLLEEAPAPPAPQVEPPKPVPHAAAARRPAPAPVAAPMTPAADAAPEADAAIMLPAEAAAPAPPAVSHASVEAAYAAALRENVDARTEVPKTAEYRLLKPSGAPQVCFTLDRGGGNPSNVAVTHRSGSTILDTQALRIVAAGHYPPFPEAAFPGEQRHVFVVTIEFHS